MSRTFLIGISGASGSGKTELSRMLQRRLEAQFGAIPLICDDDYYHDQSGVPLEDRALVNYDHPDALEHSLLIDHLARLKRGEVIDKPIYNFATHTRIAKSEEVFPAPFIILEGILIFHSPELRDVLDWKVFVETGLEVCLARRIRRDVLERGRTEISVRQQFESSVEPMFHQFVAPSAKFADQVVSGEAPYDDVIEGLLDRLVSWRESD